MGGKGVLKKSVNRNHESWHFMNPLSVWDNKEKVAWIEPPARKYGLFLGETLRSGPHLPGDSSWRVWRAGGDWKAGRRKGKMFQVLEEPGQRVSTDPSALLPKRSPESCALRVALCGTWDYHKIQTERKTLIPLLWPRGEEPELEETDFTWNVALPLTGCVALEMSLALSETQLPHLCRDPSPHHSV